MKKISMSILILLGVLLMAGCGGSGGGSSSGGGTLNIQVATATAPLNGLVVHTAIMQLSFDGKVIGQTTGSSTTPGPNTAYQYETFSIPNVSPGKHIFQVKCITNLYPQFPGGSVFPIYPSNVTADIGNFGIALGDTVTVNLTVS